MKPVILLDSGAYSAKNSGAEIELPEYIEFVREHGWRFKGGVICLDVIGDRKASYENWRIMRDEGVDTMPVFHLQTDRPEDDSYEWLERYLEEADYIAVGAIAKMNLSLKMQGLDFVWNKYLTDNSGKPIVKVHGLGITTAKIMLRYPWYSVDSTTWTNMARNGQIYFPRMQLSGGTNYDWVRTIGVSDQFDNDESRVRGFYGLPKGMRDRIIAHCAEYGFKLKEDITGRKLLPRRSRPGETTEPIYDLGMKVESDNDEDEENLTNSYKEREKFNLVFYNELQKYLEKKGRRIRIYHVPGNLKQFQTIVDTSTNRLGVTPKVLVSYHFLRMHKSLRNEIFTVTEPETNDG